MYIRTYIQIKRKRGAERRMNGKESIYRGEKDACGKTTIESYVSVARKERERREKAEREKRV